MPEEQEEYITIQAAAETIGVKRASLYYYINMLRIDTHQFLFDNHAYLKKEDVELIREAKSTPWKLGLVKQKRGRKKKAQGSN
ncbi:hypothetical protein EPA93_18155 [Ktedonosporobacter rubrisoli]|uniref:DNA-binding protein n=1 Tax=Ktedonosporobacter rubrisoli TaxID=2509675 RepID=A0A4P6JRI0_KTERU|nr:hypothetical protein [Ktedonosporobacter rubrisoli]QBD77812.1 hypothetical protein EPA93_18155 [Ktedonosporobacter rubrisoli]